MFRELMSQESLLNQEGQQELVYESLAHWVKYVGSIHILLAPVFPQQKSQQIMVVIGFINTLLMVVFSCLTHGSIS